MKTINDYLNEALIKKDTKIKNNENDFYLVVPYGGDQRLFNNYLMVFCDVFGYIINYDTLKNSVLKDKKTAIFKVPDEYNSKKEFGKDFEAGKFRAIFKHDILYDFDKLEKINKEDI
jgi:hypothetical protein